MIHKRELIDNILDSTFNFDNNYDSDIETTCLSCGFTERVLNFIYDEMSRKKYHLKIKKKFLLYTVTNVKKKLLYQLHF